MKDGIIIDPAAKEQFPWLKLGYAFVRGITAADCDAASDLRTTTQQYVRERSAELRLKARTISSFYRDLESDRSSHIETLLRAVSNGRTIKPVSPVVDAVLCAELQTATLMGVHDVDKIAGQIRFGFPGIGESFMGIGGKTVSPPSADLVLRDDAGIWASYSCGPDRRTLVDEATMSVLVVGFYTPVTTDSEMTEALTRAINFLARTCAGASSGPHTAQ